jgi:hypothetical protein
MKTKTLLRRTSLTVRRKSPSKVEGIFEMWDASPNVEFQKGERN